MPSRRSSLTYTRRSLEAALDVDDGDVGCAAALAGLDVYVEAELRGHESSPWLEGIAIHLRHCPACQRDHDGLLAIVGREESL